ncbi:hypothetical protein J4G37_25080 [Microvirga sp. 3-52]|nr:hypothetical protein [Microvirga sp. 3-52]
MVRLSDKRQYGHGRQVPVSPEICSPVRRGGRMDAECGEQHELSCLGAVAGPACHPWRRVALTDEIVPSSSGPISRE